MQEPGDGGGQLHLLPPRGTQLVCPDNVSLAALVQDNRFGYLERRVKLDRVDIRDGNISPITYLPEFTGWRYVRRRPGDGADQERALSRGE